MSSEKFDFYKEEILIKKRLLAQEVQGKGEKTILEQPYFF